ncbi:hypothetical protein [Paraflavitalea sp. CAU 1676]|uniref:hypothetical protein n=1 Tax=Paraflavitalea sp. CAU 1676 TaxID=3032598 RepID=UPI0023DAF9A5|nr:hypothetical protein [Paraflavitalea sp. CAU 1676]MDF2189766.1 hypothetical protein [Paraflavitalea sp. CAU 1676]
MKKVLLSMMMIISVMFTEAQSLVQERAAIGSLLSGSGWRFIEPAKTIKSRRDWLLQYHHVIDSVCLQLATLGGTEELDEYTIKVSTVNAGPVTVWSLPTQPGHKYRVEVVCNGVLDEGNASLEGRKKRGFLVDASWDVNAGQLTAIEPTEYLGAGLTAADYIITHQGSDIILQAVGEANALINFEFKVKVYTLWANL